MYQPAKRRRGFSPPPQQQYDHHPLRDIKRQQAVCPEGITDFPWIQADGHQGGNGQKNADCRQPALDTANLAGTDGSPLPPQKPVSQRLEWQSNTAQQVDATDIRAALEGEQAELVDYGPGFAVAFKVRSKKSAVAVYALTQFFQSRKAWISSGKISSSNTTC